VLTNVLISISPLANLIIVFSVVLAHYRPSVAFLLLRLNQYEPIISTLVFALERRLC
jgi:hypothetical protein